MMMVLVAVGVGLQVAEAQEAAVKVEAVPKVGVALLKEEVVQEGVAEKGDYSR